MTKRRHAQRWAAPALLLASTGAAAPARAAGDWRIVKAVIGVQIGR